MSYNINELDEPLNIRINNDRYMTKHIGSNKNLDTDIQYVNEQKKIIDDNNSKIYQLNHHNINFDEKEQSYNAIQHQHPLGINMVMNHGDKGFDYRDFPNEIIKETE